MPARTGALIESSVKAVMQEDLISSPWCITDRNGLYVHEWAGDEREANEVDYTLTRVGTVRQVNWSGVYQMQGRPINVFKIKVYIKGYDHGNDTIDESLTWYVVVEENFVDFSDQEWRDQRLNQSELACANVDGALMDASVVVIDKKGNCGKWLKNWFSQQGGEVTQSANAPNRTQSTTNPSVFGMSGTIPDKTDESASGTPPKKPTQEPPTVNMWQRSQQQAKPGK